eukprot:UN26311
MNQQRTRRFVKVKEADKFHVKCIETLELWKQLGLKCPRKIERLWNSNQITPGTKFMQEANAWLHKFAKEWATGHPGVEVIVSDSDCYGEGEHKILEWMRAENKNYTHAMWGNDSDLYLLGMICDIKNLYLLRENQNAFYHYKLCFNRKITNSNVQ